MWQTLSKFAKNLFIRPAALLLGLGLTAIAPTPNFAAPLEHPHISSRESSADSLNIRLIAQQQSAIFVYGTSPIAQQWGQDYMVLQVDFDNHVQGAFYQVDSEYACFSGEIHNGKLDLAVIDPYEQVAYAYQLDYTAQGYLANGGDRPVLQFIPEGFQPINVPSELDYALLQECGGTIPQTKAMVET